MNKYLFSIFTYFATFFLSVILVGLLTGSPAVSTSCPQHKAGLLSVDPAVRHTTQSRIIRLLESDKKFGIEYYKNSEDAESAHRLVEQMEDLDDSVLPDDIRRAYKIHTKAWRDYAKHLNNTKSHYSSDEECAKFSREIGSTYDDLLDSARNHDVYFKP